MKDNERTFPCPITEDLCVNPGCTVTRCRDDERHRNAEASEAADKPNRLMRAEVLEVIQPYLRRKISN